MSVLRKLPFINHLVSSLSTEELTTLKAKFNVPSIERKITFVQDVNGFEFLQTSDAGLICTCTMKLSREKVVSGILIFHSVDLCVLIGYTDGVAGSDILPVYLLNFSNRKYTGFGELLTADELRNVVDDALQGEGGSSDIEFNVDIPEGVTPEKATNVRAGEDYFEFSDKGIPAPGGAKQVLVSNDDLEPEWTDAVPLAENLKTTAGVTNDTVYSAGPTGGLADISNDNVGYLQEVKGYSIVWNQLLDAEHPSVTLKNGYWYAKFTASGAEIVQGDGETVVSYVNEFSRLYDLDTMFQGNYPFNVSENETEYPANGTLPAQVVTPIQKFMRLFADIDLYHEPYNAGEFKSVSCNKITEVGRNLWNGDETNGILLLPGYRYEIYLTGGTSNFVNIKLRGTNTWGQTALTRAQRADGKYIWYYAPSVPTYVKSYATDSNGSITYVGFVHSGNNCLTTGSYTTLVPYTNVEIPEYTKKDYSISGISGLRGIYFGEYGCNDTVDYIRVAEIDLSDLHNVMFWDEDTEIWYIAEEDLPNGLPASGLVENYQLIIPVDLYVEPAYYYYDYSQGDTRAFGIALSGEGIDADHKPNGVMLYPISKIDQSWVFDPDTNNLSDRWILDPQPTGQPAFAPITLDPVDDMGFEYFSGMTYAPVNQKTFYGINLKDKLVNLQEGTSVEVAEFNKNNTALNGIKIGNTTYANLPFSLYPSAYGVGFSIGLSTSLNGNYAIALGTSARANAPSAIAIGYDNLANGDNAIAIGKGSYGVGANSVAIGNLARCEGARSVSIGNNAKTYVQDVVNFDGENGNYEKDLMLRGPNRLFFRYENITSSKTTLGSYVQGHTLSEYITNNELVLGDGKYWISYTDASTHKGFASDEITGVHITLVVNGSTSHSVVGMDLLPYDATNAYGFNSYARVDVDGTVNDIVATIDADGAIVITAPAGSTIASAKYYLR